MEWGGGAGEVLATERQELGRGFISIGLHRKEGVWEAFIQFPLGLPRNLLLSMNQAIWFRLADPVQQQGVAIIYPNY